MRIALIPILALAFATVVAFAAMLALHACALRLPAILATWVPVECPAPAVSRLPELSEEGRELQRAIDEAEIRLAGVRCPAPESEPFIAPEPAEMPFEPGAVIDEEAWRKRDIASLEGCWALDSNYMTENVEGPDNRPTGRFTHYSDWQICFDRSGSGSSTMTGVVGDINGPIQGGDQLTCSGGGAARFDEEGSVVITEHDRVACSGGRTIFRRQLTCSLDENGHAICDAMGLEDSGSTRGIRFRPLE